MQHFITECIASLQERDPDSFSTAQIRFHWTRNSASAFAERLRFLDTERGKVYGVDAYEWRARVDGETWRTEM